ncbi:MAG: imidazoleglycerol-phosphate dehydratase HisB [Acholeplasmatales bacterium]|nr:MAG: imidazoleglycerol-phosphate dehydratase HisB [Acholeplasmatales bacterium]
MRQATVERNTKETTIRVDLTLDLAERGTIETGVGFFDHMLDLMAFHGGFKLSVKCEGDLYIDDHHTVEDVGLALGQAFREALGDKLGLRRYGMALIPMDESLARVVVDVSMRPLLVYHAALTRKRVGTMDTQNVREFLRAFSQNAAITLHAEVLYGENAHHQVEALFKALGRALADASAVISTVLPSTKGVL